MATVTNLFVDISTGNLLAGLNSSTTIGPPSFFYGDEPTFNIYLLTPSGVNASPGVVSYNSVPTAGLTLQFYLDDGTITPGTIYAQQLVWTATTGINGAPCFSGIVSFLTADLAALLGTGSSANCYLKIGTLQNAIPTTYVSERVTVNVGLPTASAPTPVPGQQALTVQQGNQTYYPIAGLAGLPIIIISPNGKQFQIAAVDNPDGTASIKTFGT